MVVVSTDGGSPSAIDEHTQPVNGETQIVLESRAPENTHNSAPCITQPPGELQISCDAHTAPSTLDDYAHDSQSEALIEYTVHTSAAVSVTALSTHALAPIVMPSVPNLLPQTHLSTTELPPSNSSSSTPTGSQISGQRDARSVHAHTPQLPHPPPSELATAASQQPTCHMPVYDASTDPHPITVQKPMNPKPTSHTRARQTDRAAEPNKTRNHVHTCVGAAPQSAPQCNKKLVDAPDLTQRVRDQYPQRASRKIVEYAEDHIDPVQLQSECSKLHYSRVLADDKFESLEAKMPERLWRAEQVTSSNLCRDSFVLPILIAVDPDKPHAADMARLTMGICLPEGGLTLDSILQIAGADSEGVSLPCSSLFLLLVVPVPIGLIDLGAFTVRLSLCSFTPCF